MHSVRAAGGEPGSRGIVMWLTALVRYNLHAIKFIHFKGTTQLFYSKFTELYKHHHPIVEHFHQSKKNTRAHLLSFSPATHNHESIFCFSRFSFFWAFHINEIIQCVFFCGLFHFISHNVSEFHISCGMCQYFG